MTPRIKHVYKSANNRRRSSSGGVILPANGAFLESYKSQAVRDQQHEMERMRSELRDRERKILHDITTFKNIPTKSLVSRSPEKIQSSLALDPIYTDDDNVILSHDIINNNETISFISNLNEMPSFITSPVIFKEFNEEENNSSFILVEKSKLSQINFIPNENESSNGSTSPNKVPGSSDNIPSTDYFESEFTAADTQNAETESQAESKAQESILIQNTTSNSNTDRAINNVSLEPFASPPISDSDKSNTSSIQTQIPRSEIEFFTIDPEYLRSFKGIWQRKLDNPVQAANPTSPDHFEISMQNKIKKDVRKKASK